MRLHPRLTNAPEGAIQNAAKSASSESKTLPPQAHACLDLRREVSHNAAAPSPVSAMLEGSGIPMTKPPT